MNIPTKSAELLAKVIKGWTLDKVCDALDTVLKPANQGAVNMNQALMNELHARAVLINETHA